MPTMFSGRAAFAAISPIGRVDVFEAMIAWVKDAAPDLLADGEMHADAALSQSLRDRLVPDSRFEGPANLLVMPNLDAANITLTALSASSSSPTVGPMLMGLKQTIHVLTPGVTSRGILNLTAIAAAEVAREG